MVPQRIILPPIWLILFLLAAFMMDRWLPLLALPAWLSVAAVPFSLAGLVIIMWPAVDFLRAKTGMVPFSEATSLVTGGLYRFSRNPMYVGMWFLLLGGALKLGTLGALLPVPFFPLVIRQRFILPEEAFLLTAFGDEYRDYCSRVRRWL